MVQLKNSKEVLTIRVFSESPTDMRVELFNSLASKAFNFFRPDLEIFAGRNPYNEYRNVGDDTQPLIESNVWSVKGELVSYLSAVDSVTIQGNPTSYKTIFEFLKSNNLILNKVKLTSTDNLQLIQSLRFTQRDIFGSYDQIDIFPENYKSPEQYQDNIIEVPLQQREINGFSGLEFTILAGSAITFDFFAKTV